MVVGRIDVIDGVVRCILEDVVEMGFEVVFVNGFVYFKCGEIFFGKIVFVEFVVGEDVVQGVCGGVFVWIFVCVGGVDLNG